MTTFELAAAARGIGTCWAGFFMTAVKHRPQLHEALDLPGGHVLSMALMVGYSKLQFLRLPERKKPNITWR
jgi:nitroreductase